MTDGHLNLDLLPDLAHGRGVLSAEDENHLRSCGDCRAEWDLVRSVAHLGIDRLAEPDAPAIATAVRARLAQAAVAPVRTRWVPVLLGLAAVLLIAVWSRRPVTQDSDLPVAAFSPDLVLHELDSLDVTQLERVLAEIPGETNHVERLELGDLTTEDLERVLRSMEE